MRQQILQWASEGRLTGDVGDALAAAGAQTRAGQWRRLLDRLLLGGGVLLLGSALIFFKPPIALPIMVAAIIIFFMPALQPLFKKKRPSAATA